MNIEEGVFKTIFFLAIIIFIITVIGIFLLLIKILLLFTPELTIMGVTMTQ